MQTHLFSSAQLDVIFDDFARLQWVNKLTFGVALAVVRFILEVEAVTKLVLLGQVEGMGLESTQTFHACL